MGFFDSLARVAQTALHRIFQMYRSRTQAGAGRSAGAAGQASIARAGIEGRAVRERSQRPGAQSQAAGGGLPICTMPVSEKRGIFVKKVSG
jgi:hypothetical protein